MPASFLISFKILFKKIGEEEYFKYKKENKKFNYNNCPKGFPHGHVFKTIVVKNKCLLEKILDHDVILPPFQN
jgi:hypothetical protein